MLLRTLFFLSVLSVSALASPKMAFWDEQRKGANFFNHLETEARMASAKALGIEVVRLVFNKWDSTAVGARQGDFLLGPKGQYKGLVPGDLKRLVAVLDQFHRHGLGVVLTALSLPGLRWIQHNNGQPDHRLWGDFKYHRLAADYWRDLARAVGQHPAVMGYNLLNEPHPERAPPAFKDWYLGDYPAWARSVKGTPRDLNRFHRTLAAAVREVDKKTPIVLDAGFYATPWAFRVLEPLSDPHVLYSFHMYEPYAFTSYRNGKNGFALYAYPGAIPIGESEPPPVQLWDKTALSRFLEPVRAWQKRHGIAPQRIFASEFGLFRGNPGGARYLADLLSLFDGEGWHWAFYSYREDTWAGMDYELGTTKLSSGQKYPLAAREKHYRANSLFKALKKSLRN